MPDIETLDILTINCNKLDKQTQREQIYNKMQVKWWYTNNMQKKGKPETCNTNTTNIPNSNGQDNPIIIDNNNNNLKYFIPGTQQEADKTSPEITKKNYTESSKMYSLELCVLRHILIADIVRW